MVRGEILFEYQPPILQLLDSQFCRPSQTDTINRFAGTVLLRCSNAS